MISQEFNGASFVAGRRITLNGVDHAIGDAVNVAGVSFHRLRQMVASRHLRAVEPVDPNPVAAEKPVAAKPRSAKRAA